MYFVDREHIQRTLTYLEETLTYVANQESWNTIIEKRALERFVHMIIESIADVGNSMIDGFIMRDPGSLEDIIDILEDEKVIPSERAKGLKKIIELRKVLVQNYLEIDHSILNELTKQEMSHLHKFPNDVRHYLENELGPVSAFRN
ncbi:type VII toxin-antitoxin system HepT family RNase toxin [Litchfieldia alkalitelluris]|uniref:type VII toxin-antitoxin system HepT family RNase toxin n=1 Tax=Litchfieldia alkalitelluris TaxID=304268 RepID=UPI0009988B5F|nr:DUF86 domain-containing protein [Litchfieldia alkalitelluris]